MNETCGRGRPRKTWHELVRADLKMSSLGVFIWTCSLQYTWDLVPLTYVNSHIIPQWTKHLFMPCACFHHLLLQYNATLSSFSCLSSSSQLYHCYLTAPLHSCVHHLLHFPSPLSSFILFTTFLCLPRRYALVHLPQYHSLVQLRSLSWKLLGDLSRG